MDMNGWNQTDYVNQIAADYQKQTVGNEKEKNSTVAGKEGAEESGLKEVGGRTVGNPRLSEKALKYYEQLKRKYSNMEFILVSPEKKQEAESMKGTYASSKQLLVLIDSDKIEKMAQDEEYRWKYEGILNGATSRMTQMKKSMGTNAKKVKSFGMTFDDHGNASFFAVVDKMLAEQRVRIVDRHEKNVKNEKEAAKAREAEKAEEAAKKERAGEKKKPEDGRGEDITVTASSFDELLQKINAVINDIALSGRSDSVLTEEEKRVGGTIDYSL